jgi:peptidoglycan hydrolase-like protein with peptidoglycan-binding domain
MANGVLRRGSSGNEVRLLQRALAAAGFDPGAIDGVFGARTERAVRAFQAFNGLPVDGVVGNQTWAALRSLRIPLIGIRQPRPIDIVGDPIVVCGIAGAFEATFQARVRDANGNAFVTRTITAGSGTGLSEVHFQLPTGVPPTPLGSVEIFEISASDGSEINKVTIPVVFGRAIIASYSVFQPYTVQAGDTLSALAQRFYGNASLSSRIVQANPHQIIDPNVIFTGQVLRIPL